MWCLPVFTPTVPSVVPSVLDGRALSATEVMLFWAPVMHQSVEGYQVNMRTGWHRTPIKNPTYVIWCNLCLCGFQLKYWRKQIENDSTNPPIMVSSLDNQTRVERLKPNSRYTMEVRAFNSAGLGPPKRIEITTKKARKSISVHTVYWSICT